MKKVLIASMLLSAMLSSAGASAGVVDTIDALSPLANVNPNYFVPGSAATFDSPYYRYSSGSGWQWKHNAITGAYSTAALSISAYDVDAPPQVGYIGEIDLIQGYETSTNTWETIGTLAGANEIYSFTTFSLGSSWSQEIGLGLALRILIDQNNEGWAVALAKSVIATDGEGPGNPNPGAEVPVPAAAWLFGSALLGFVGFRRKTL